MSVILSTWMLEMLAVAYFGDLGLHSQRTIVAIALAESGGSVSAIHNNVDSGHQPEGSAAATDMGLLQINSIHGYDSSRLLSDPAYNFECGRAVYDGAGGSFRPWVTYQLGQHVKFMPKSSDISAPRRFGGYLRLLWQAAKAAEEEASMIPLHHVNGQDRYMLRRVR